MFPAVHIGTFDLLLIAVVSVHATVLAYLFQPRWKALLLALPVPFTLATLAVDRSIDATNAAGLVALLAYTHGVRLLHYNLRVPILAAIAAAGAGYCALGGALAGVVPTTDAAFWAAVAAAFAVALALHLGVRLRVERGHRTPLPVYVKLPTIAGVIFVLVLIKGLLRGFMTVFPMVGVVAAYEARHSLWTICRQMQVFVLLFLPLLVVVRLTQGALGLPLALALGWVVFLGALAPVTRLMWRRQAAFEERAAAPPAVGES